MQDVLDLAQKLGQAIAQNERTVAFQNAQKSLQEDEQAAKLLNEYETHAQKISQMEKQGQPIEVADKQALKNAEAALSGNENMKQFLRTQVDYMEMMRKVNTIIQSALGIKDPAQE